MRDTYASGAPVALPADARLVVPLMAATGGTGRSTLACLLAAELAAAGGTVVMDLGARPVSPWPRWAPGGAGLAAVPADRPHARAAIRAAAARRGPVDVLTDAREWHAPPLRLPAEPAAWYQLGAAGGWQLLVADTAHPVAHDVLAGYRTGGRGLTRAWCELPFAVPVLCAAATAEGVRTLQRAVTAMGAAGLPLRRTVAVLVAVDSGRGPAAVRAAAEELADRLYDVQELPHDPAIRAHGLAGGARPRGRTRRAAARIAEAVLEAARTTWGEDLPPAPVPAPLPAPPA
ncbi:hypothetical protein [Streptomyces antimicrobicus]|uniref:CobQ/CobB/MinD/ParA nucleotide binding domain-containing protein n=1 Tax=Streptomyces antimicrobicus TaxID=2883108 RepID=A0ABS8BBF6_9ACTN|nr:hypothetical protein [Streptomyces antimicrobicus]MCB5181949.1 hypothetical protein [Streptomyces antimicrobicus]